MLNGYPNMFVNENVVYLLVSKRVQKLTFSKPKVLLFDNACFVHLRCIKLVILIIRDDVAMGFSIIMHYMKVYLVNENRIKNRDKTLVLS